MDINLLFEKLITENEYIDKHNFLVSKLPAPKVEELTIHHTDSIEEIKHKRKKAKNTIKYYGYFFRPLYPHIMKTGTPPDDTKDDTDTPDIEEPSAPSPSLPAGPTGGETDEDAAANEVAFEYTGGQAKPVMFNPLRSFTIKNADTDAGVTDDTQDDDDLEEALSSTERMRRYNRRHPEKVRAYLKKTQNDRVVRNRDRKKAVTRYGKSKMKNHDVHHPSGPDGGKWKLAKKNHGPDKKNVNENYLVEGGAGGHMAHPYEDDSLTFANVKDMIKRGLVGGLDTEAPVTEKLDGQNIAFSVRDGQVVFARNKGQVKNRGRNALDAAGLRQMFAGRGSVEKAFGGAAEDLQKAIDALPEKERTQMFANGAKFMNTEIIFPDSKNVIPYDKAVLVFHGTIKYDTEGNELGRNIEDSKKLSDAITRVNAQQQNTFGISGPRTISFNDAETSRNLEKMKEYDAQLRRLQKEFKLTDKSTIEDYKIAWWKREIDNMGVDWTPKEKKGLIARWATGNKNFGVKDIEDPEKKKLFRDFEKTKLANAQKTVTRPLEHIFLKVGTDTLARVTNLLSANNPKAAMQLKKELLSAIKQIRDTGDVNQLAILQKEIERLDTVGIDSVVPSEGLVFIYNGKPYKFTGAFAPVNQILGTLKFGRGKAKVVEPDEPQEQPSTKQPTEPVTPPRTVAIFTGRFQPFHAGHYSIYQSLVDKFGKDNVFIASSDKTDAIKSPFSFKEKKTIMTRMFDIPEDMVVQVKNPYAPTEILSKLPKNTIYVTSVSQKDAERLGGKYFKPYDEKSATKPYETQGYVIIAPELQLTVDGKNISGTQLRAVMGNPNITNRAKQEIFTKVYGKFDTAIFDKITKITTKAEEARKITDTHGPGSKTSSTKKSNGSEEPVKAKQKKVLAAPKDPSFYKPGETWETGGGNFGGKNKKLSIQYFGTKEKAKKFATT